ncbi:MAG: pyrroline-5-carboxylate reductase family protein, partial [Planctomycetota bacterium]
MGIVGEARNISKYASAPPPCHDEKRRTQATPGAVKQNLEETLMARRLGIIGGGNMGQAIARGAITQRVLERDEIVVVETDVQKHAAIEQLGCTAATEPRVAADCEQMLLAVKPQSFASLAESLGGLTRPTVVISIMAGIGTETIRRRLGAQARVIRAMPNTPCQLGEGMTGIAIG